MFELSLTEFAETGENEAKLLEDKESYEGYVEYLCDGLSSIELSIKKAKEIMGEDFYGEDEFEGVFGIGSLDWKKVDRVPYTLDELRRAKEYGFYLVLRQNPDVKNLHDAIEEAKLEFRDEDIAPIATHQFKNRWVLVKKEAVNPDPLAPAYEKIFKIWQSASRFYKENVRQEWVDTFQHLSEMIQTLKAQPDPRSSLNLLLTQFDHTNNGITEALTFMTTSLQEEVYDYLLRSRGGWDQALKTATTTSTKIMDTRNRMAWRFVDADIHHGRCMTPTTHLDNSAASFRMQLGV